jgi:glycosyltransferase involved in cell wall biosynthesis
MSKPLVSIIINNYNYENFLAESIESALNQSYQPIEVIVVDDGSTDGSRQIITNYEEKIISILKENGGQGSAFNAGFATSQGEFICFLDADDVLLPSAIEKASVLIGDPNVVLVHWPLLAIDTQGKSLGRFVPDEPLPEGNLRNALLKGGIEGFNISPTSGNIWSRNYLEQIFPLPEKEYRFAADSFLNYLAPLNGIIKTIPEYQTLYRIHGQNNSAKVPYHKRFKQYNLALKQLYQSLKQQGIGVDEVFESWRGPYYRQLEHMVEIGQELEPHIPPDSSYILVDMCQWSSGQLLEHCRSIPFLEKDGLYWGSPINDTHAIEEFDRLHRKGANFIVFGYPAFWWFDYYPEFNRYLRSNFRCILDNENLIVFDLQLVA